MKEVLFAIEREVFLPLPRPFGLRDLIAVKQLLNDFHDQLLPLPEPTRQIACSEPRMPQDVRSHPLWGKGTLKLPAPSVIDVEQELYVVKGLGLFAAFPELMGR